MTTTKTDAIGTCTLVGAGPGDPELLTLKAVKAIQAATVLLVDDLVNPEVLQWARPDARIVHVGKRGGCKSTPQAFIEKLMVAAVREGEHVVRLKGGDPFIFGRGGEEVEHLQAHGIGVTVVNGVTAGLAAATALGVPLTHRDRAHGVVFMTGHAQPGQDETDWRAIGAMAHAAGLTLVIYMGVNGVERICSGLLQALPAHTPAAIVESASRAEQRHALTTLDALARTAADQAMRSPSVILIGDVLRAISLLESTESSAKKTASGAE